MAIIWKKKVGNTRYEVRSHGASMRLYTDGVFHSQYNNKSLFTGSVWDILALPALLYPPKTIKTVLVLGVGGGSVIQMLLKIINPTSVIGIEIDPIHLFVAKHFFKLTDERIHLEQADAVEWLKQYKGPKFDLIIEDLYGEKGGEPERAVQPDEAWFDLLTKNLSKDGALVMNYVSIDQLKEADYFHRQKTRSKFSSALQFNTSSYENRVAVFAKRKVSSSKIKSNLNALSFSKKQIKNLNYSCRKLD